MGQRFFHSIWRFLQQHRSDLGVLGLFIILGLIYWWPLPLHLRTGQLEWPVVDPAFAQWIIGWGARALTHAPWRFFEAPMFYPWHHVLAWGDNMFAITIFAVPLIPIFGLLATYNLLLISTSIFSAFTLYLLANHLFKDRRAAIVAAIIWGFSYSRYVEYGHIQILALQWVPLSFLLAEKVRTQYKRSYLVWFIIVTFLTLATNIYLAFFLLISLGIYGVIMWLLRALDWRTIKRLVLAVVVAVVASAPVYLPSFILNLRHPTVHLDQYAATLDQFTPFPPTGQLVRVMAGLPAGPANVFSVGIVSLLLFLIGVGVALWHWRKQPFFAAMIVLAGFAGLSCFGPTITWHTHVIIARNPLFYLLFKLLPGYKVLRTPTRWIYIFGLGLALVAGLGFKAATAGIKSKTVFTMITILVAGWIFWESLPTPILVHATYNIKNYPVYSWLATQPTNQPILELPNFPIPWRLDTAHIESKRIFLSTYYWHPRVGGGVTPYVPVGYTNDQMTIGNIGVDPKAMDLVRKWGIKYVIFLPGDYEGPAWNNVTPAQLKARLDATPGLHIYKTFSDATVYEVSGSS